MATASLKIPLVSVLMPAYNAEKYVGEAIESILNQTFTDFEFIIVDDCSTDGTWNIIQEYAKKDTRIVALRNDKNAKICVTLNRGIDIARGKYIARMDADDWSYPDRLAKQVAFMDTHPEVVISGGTMDVCDEKMNVLNQRRYNLTDEAVRKKLFRYSPFCHPLVIYKTEPARDIGMYDLMYVLAQDYEFYFRLGKVGEFANLPDVLLKLRTHSRSSSASKTRLQEHITLSIRKKAVKSLGYHMSLSDYAYYLGQKMSMYVVPSRLKFWLFNWLRK